MTIFVLGSVKHPWLAPSGDEAAIDGGDDVGRSDDDFGGDYECTKPTVKSEEAHIIMVGFNADNIAAIQFKKYMLLEH